MDAMLSVHSPKPSLSFLHHHHHNFTTTTTTISTTNPFTSAIINLRKPLLKPISATLSSSPNPPQQVYQPFRPPPSPLPPKFRSLDAGGRLEVLSNRLGLWFEYAPLIPALIQEGFSHSSIEETTGISGVEQNRLVVAAKVRDSLIQSKTADPETLAFFDTGGAELLYEIRLLSATQRAEAAKFAVQRRYDAKGAQELARSMKDFPRRRGDKGWEKFNYNFPGDCLAFMYYRQSREHKIQSERRKSALQQALEVAATESAKKLILEELESRTDTDNEPDIADVKVPVVRMKVGEVAEATRVALLPVCRAEEIEKDILEAPWECKSEGVFGVVVAEKEWKRWVVLPGWEVVVGLGKGGVVVAFSDARILPWKVNRWYKDEAILVVVDRERKKIVADDGFYLVAVEGDGGRSNGLKVERGVALRENDVEESLGTVVMVVRPPRDDSDDQLTEEEWE